MIKQVTIGDISYAWLVGHLDKDKVELPLTVDYTCKIVVIKISDETTVLARDVTAKQDNTFLVFLTEIETAALEHKQRYRIVAEIANPTLAKPLKKEVMSEQFEAIIGHIN